MKKFSKGPALSRAEGFTIIELIVVIAIIAVLAGIVLVNVTQYINKAKITAIKADFSTLPSAAATYFSTPGNNGYDGLCDNDATFKTIETSINKINNNSNYQCHDIFNASGSCATSSEWVAFAPLLGSTYWCVDATGVSKEFNGEFLPNSCDCANTFNNSTI